MTTRNKWILGIAIVVGVAIVVYGKRIAQLFNSYSGNSSSQKSQSCESITAEAKALYSQYYHDCYTNKKDQAKCDEIMQKLNDLQKLYTSKQCGKVPVTPGPKLPINEPVICDPKHLGYDTFGKPRWECGYKPTPTPVPPNPQPNPYTNCASLKEIIQKITAMMQQSPNSSSYQNWKKYLESLKTQYNQMDCGGGAKPGTGG